jgi:pimeloyl-ACP methyl ester carboxylesterase
MRTTLARLALAVATTAATGCGSISSTPVDATRGDASVTGDGAIGDGAPADAPVSGADPTQPGACAVTTASATLRRGSRNIPVVAHVPTTPGGAKAPLVVFLPGFSIASSRYAALADRLASHCLVVVRADPPGNFLDVDHVAMSQDAAAVIDWAVGATGPLAGKVDAAKIAMAGHSLGGKVATMTAAADARVKALFAIDPVNGGSPLSGYSTTLPDIVPDRVTPLTIPVAFLGETTDGAGGVGGMPCAPTDQNFQTFYAAATSAAWASQYLFTAADHIDYVNDVAGCGFTCTACTEGTADPATVQASTKTLAVAFARRHLLGDAGMDPFLVGAQVPAGVVATHR